MQEAARDAAAAAVDDVLPPLRALLAEDVGAQRTNPLSLVRRAVQHPTRVLAAAGVAPVARDDQARRLFPDDAYDLVPANFADLDPSVQEPGIAWGAAKAHVSCADVAARRRLALGLVLVGRAGFEALPAGVGDRPGLEEQAALGARERGGLGGVHAAALHDLAAGRAGGVVAAVLAHRHADGSLPRGRALASEPMVERLVVVGGDAAGMAAAMPGPPAAALPRDRGPRAGVLDELLGLRHPVPRRR